jgi:hypothetical protein
LDQRFAALKKSLVKPENKQKVIESYDRLVKILRKEVDHIDKHGAALVPEIDFDDVRKNGMWIDIKELFLTVLRSSVLIYLFL